MKVEVAVLGSRPCNKPAVSVDVKKHQQHQLLGVFMQLHMALSPAKKSGIK